MGGCRRETKSVAETRAPALAHLSLPSSDCRSCHEEIYKSWSGSHHALAHRTVDPQADADAFVPARDVTINAIDYHLELKDGKPAFTEKRAPGAPADHYTAEFVLGHTPLRQYVVPAGESLDKAKAVAAERMISA